MEKLPSILISYAYLREYLSHKRIYPCRDWVLDSGAYSALTRGMKVSIAGYISTCKHLLLAEKSLLEVYALDVIGDHKQTLINTELMWTSGIEAIPCYHLGEPWEVFEEMVKKYPKVAVGGIANVDSVAKYKWIGQCFARAWPKKIHGFACGSEDLILKFPFHSVDATSWRMGASVFGQWNYFNHAKLRTKGAHKDLRAEVIYYLRLEQRAKQRWSREMQKIAGGNGPNIHLAVAGGCEGWTTLEEITNEKV